MNLPARVGPWTRPAARAGRHRRDDLRLHGRRRRAVPGLPLRSPRRVRVQGQRGLARDDPRRAVLDEDARTMRSGCCRRTGRGSCRARLAERRPAVPSPPPRLPLPPPRSTGRDCCACAPGSLYVRMLASRETPEAREAVLAIARELSASPLPGDAAPPPASASARLPAARATAARLRSDRICFFRSHLVLNSAYYLASDDILGLGLDVDGGHHRVQAGRGRRAADAPDPRALSSAARARAGLATFTRAYVPGGRRSRGRVRPPARARPRSSTGGRRGS